MSKILISAAIALLIGSGLTFGGVYGYERVTHPHDLNAIHVDEAYLSQKPWRYESTLTYTGIIVLAYNSCDPRVREDLIENHVMSWHGVSKAKALALVAKHCQERYGSTRRLQR